MKKGRLQAKDIDDLEVLRFIHAKRNTPLVVRGKTVWMPEPDRWVLLFDFEEDPKFSGYGRKLLLAKLGSLLRRRYIDGCDCGCRGDFELTKKGLERVLSAS